MNKKIKVLVVDDSAFIREALAAMISEDPELEVIGTAEDPFEAREKIKSLNPDVITLDIEMPKMDGIAFLEKIMTLRPMPVIMISTLTQKGADATIRALELGAMDYIGKPAAAGEKLFSIRDELLEKLRAVRRARVRQPSNSGPHKIITLKSKPSERAIIAIGSSTGGVEALRHVLPLMPENTPPIMIVQHMPAHFTTSFANRMNGLCAISVVEAEDGMPLETGTAYIAPGGKHLRLLHRGGVRLCSVSDGENISGHKPSADALFFSVAEIADKTTTGVILTGMGRDGAAGLLKMRDQGSYNIGQDEESCVVYGMPKAARLNGAIDEEFNINKIAQAIIKRYDASL